MTLIPILTFLAGAVVAGLIVYFKSKSQATVVIAQLQTELQVEKANQQSELQAEKGIMQAAFQTEKTDLQNEKAELQAELQAMIMKNDMLTESLKEQKSLMNEAQKQREELAKSMNVQFEVLAQKIFEEKSAKFTDQNHKNIAAIMEPLKERIKDFEKKVEETYSTERSERGVLRGELTKLMELNKVMSAETQNLTKALKGEVKTQGNWGELILENILERSGLRKGEEYIIQGTDLDLRGEDGQMLRPDVIVNLPDEKHLIVDSKMTLIAYEQYSSAETAEDQERTGKLHVEALKKHIDGLSEKKYHAADKLISPDFVILFMPLEPAFALAFKLKPELFQYAWERNVAIVSPTTLLATLRTVAALWKQDRQEKNALEIAKRGGLLYEKFAGLLKDLQNLGEKLGAAQKAHEDVIKKVSEGRGNLIDQVEDLKRLGAKTEKSLPQIETVTT
ncbi:DNA recombination protein RmuC [Bdellovibrio reynosensis]|uniref:DNA recombination protein RmuC n=1 Tax=Bdellovibrio reynosensis TaxID=2835041 RepID=A0ABY4C7M9_9BACT|nr:DNA recombination protein RmuC [Bdellovibrio reynosensis]UOE99911.1 DNA recombination protein RmuC [Bdellovibrio reynosensis]